MYKNLNCFLGDTAEKRAFKAAPCKESTGTVQKEVPRGWDRPRRPDPRVDEGRRRRGRRRPLHESEGSGKLDRARSRLYRSQILQVNMRWKALAEIYTMHSFAQLCNLNFLSKICQIFAKFCKISEIFRKILANSSKF